MLLFFAGPDVAIVFDCVLPQACIRDCTCVVVQAPFTYEALPPEKINFVPLKQKRIFNGRKLMQVWHLSQAIAVFDLLQLQGIC